MSAAYTGGVADKEGMTPLGNTRRPHLFHLLGAFAVAGLLGLGGHVAADNVINDVALVGGQKVENVTAGGAGAAVDYRIVATSGDGQTGCNAADGSAVTVSFLGLPTGVAASPASLGFTACGSDRSVTFNASTSAPAGDHQVTVSASDAGAGAYNVNPGTFILRILAPADTTPPSVAYQLDPASPDGANGWYVSPATLNWTVADAQSPITGAVGCANETLADDTTGTTRACSATSAGGTTDVTTETIRIDRTPPDVALVGGPEGGASYDYGFVPAAPTCAASDATSGLAAPCAVSGYGTSVGAHAVQASATDNASNAANETRAYTVLAWSTGGFYAPANDPLNVVKSGATVPLKFELFAGATEITDTAGLAFTATRLASCGTTAGDDVEVTTTGGTSLRYDPTAGQFVQNWQTPRGGAGQCYNVALSGAGLGAPLVAAFRLK